MSQAAVQLRYSDPENWNEPKQHTCNSEHYTTNVCNYCYKFVASIDMSVVVTRQLRIDTFHRIHKRNCSQSPSNQIKERFDKSCSKFNRHNSIFKFGNIKFEIENSTN